MERNQIKEDAAEKRIRSRTIKTLKGNWVKKITAAKKKEVPIIPLAKNN